MALNGNNSLSVFLWSPSSALKNKHSSNLCGMTLLDLIKAISLRRFLSHKGFHAALLRKTL